MKKLLFLAALAAAIALGTGGAYALQNGETAYAFELLNCTQIETHTHSVYPIVNCTKTVAHEHDGILYYAHYENDGRNHSVQNKATPVVQNTQQSYDCGVYGCAQSGQHTHDYCVNYCTVSGCIQMTEHARDGIIYDNNNSNTGGHRSGHRGGHY